MRSHKEEGKGTPVRTLLFFPHFLCSFSVRKNRDWLELNLCQSPTYRYMYSPPPIG